MSVEIAQLQKIDKYTTYIQIIPIQQHNKTYQEDLLEKHSLLPWNYIFNDVFSSKFQLHCTESVVEKR